MPQPKLLVATRNQGKLEELQVLLQPRGIEVMSLDAFDPIPDVEEDGETFVANALKKARTYCNLTGRPVLAEDSGLAVDALGGAPGVHSARWVPATDRDRVEALLARLKDVASEQRTARYVSVIALAAPDGREQTFQGTLEGRIATAPRGTGGFGYDPVFELSSGRTAAEVTREEKNAISHRGKALRRALAALEQFVNP